MKMDPDIENCKVPTLIRLIKLEWICIFQGIYTITKELK